MATESKIDALGQFELHTSLGPIGRSVNFTNSNLMMILASVLILGILYVGMRPRAVVPGGLQSLAEIAYSGILSMSVGSIGEEGGASSRSSSRCSSSCSWATCSACCPTRSPTRAISP